VAQAVFSPDGKLAFTGSGAYKLDKTGRIIVLKNMIQYEDCTARLWNAETGKETHIFKDQELPVLSVAYAPDGKHIAFGTQEPMLRLWEMDGEKPIKETKIKGGSGYVYWVTFSPDGKWLATVGLDGKVIVWEWAIGKRLWEWSPPENTYRATFAADSRHLVIPLATGVLYVMRLDGARPPSPKDTR
jgi:WD40 repeat protein